MLELILLIIVLVLALLVRSLVNSPRLKNIVPQKTAGGDYKKTTDGDYFKKISSEIIFDADKTISLIGKIPSLDKLIKFSPVTTFVNLLPTKMPVEPLDDIIVPIHECRPIEEFYAILNFLNGELEHHLQFKIVAIIGKIHFPLNIITKYYFPRVVFAVANSYRVHGKDILHKVINGIPSRDNLIDLKDRVVIIPQAEKVDYDLFINLTGTYYNTKKTQLVQDFVAADLVYLPVAANKKCIPWVIVREINEFDDAQELKERIFAWNLGQRIRGNHSITKREERMKFDRCGDCATALHILHDYRNKFHFDEEVSKNDRHAIKKIQPDYFLRHQINIIHTSKEYILEEVIYNWSIMNMPYSIFKPGKPTLEIAYSLYQFDKNISNLYPDIDMNNRFLLPLLIINPKYINETLLFFAINYKIKKSAFKYDLVPDISLDTIKYKGNININKTEEKITVNELTFIHGECTTFTTLEKYAIYSMITNNVKVIKIPNICNELKLAKEEYGFKKIIGIAINPLLRFECNFIDKFKYFMEDKIHFSKNKLYILSLVGLAVPFKYIILLHLKLHKITAIIVTSAYYRPIKGPFATANIINGKLHELVTCKEKESRFMVLKVTLNNIVFE